VIGHGEGAFRDEPGICSTLPPDLRSEEDEHLVMVDEMAAMEDRTAP